MAPTLAPAAELPDQLVTREMLRQFAPVSDNTLFTMIREGRFPRPLPRPGRRPKKNAKGETVYVEIGPRLWLLSEVRAWLAKETATRDAAPVPTRAAA